MKKLLQKIHHAYAHEWVKVVSVFLFFLATASLIYFGVGNVVSLDDPLFHIRFAENMRLHGFDVMKNFQSIYFSHMAQSHEYYIYYNFIFYGVLMLFTFFTPLIVGIKVYGVLCVAIVFTVLYFFLLKTIKKYAFLWTLLFFILFNSTYILRFFVARPFTLAPALLILEIYLLHKKKYLGLFLLSVAYFFWHTATFFFVPGIAILYVMFENFYGKKINWKLVLSVVGGTILALIAVLTFFPGFFAYMKMIFLGVVYDTLIGKKVPIAEGVEVYPADVFQIIRTNSVIFILFTVGVVLEIVRYVSIKRKQFIEDRPEDMRAIQGTLFFLSIAFFVGSLMSMRNLDFFVFFAAAYIAISMSYVMKNIEVKNTVIRKALSGALIVVMVYFFVMTSLFLQGGIADMGPYDTLEGATQWMKKNVPEKSVIFNVSWGSFTQLYYFDSMHNYVAGIEPRFLYDYNHELYWKWQHISNDGYVCDQSECEDLKSKQLSMKKESDQVRQQWLALQGDKIADTMVNDFQSHYIILANNFDKLLDALNASGRFEKVYVDEKDYGTVFIYKIKE